MERASATHLVLGGTGFLGRAVVSELVKAGRRVIVAGRAGPSIMLPGVSFAPIDFARQDWTPLLLQADVIHHYVWSNGLQAANDAPVADLDENLRGTVRLLEAIKGYPSKTLIFSSSGGTVYGQLRAAAAAEDHPLDPISAYGASKVAAEKYLGFYRAQYGVDARVARIANPFGGCPRNRSRGMIPVFLQQALANQPLTVWGDGKIVRDYLHVSDVASALMLLADMPREGGGMPVLNIGSGQGRSQMQIVEAIGALLGRAPSVNYRPFRPFDVLTSVLDAEKAFRLLGWTPLLSFDQGLARTLEELELL